MSQPTLPMETDNDEVTTSRPATQQQGRPRSTSSRLQFGTAMMPQALQQPPPPPITIRSMAAPAIATTSTTTAPTGAGNAAVMLPPPPILTVMERWVSFGTHQFTLYHTEACAVCYSYLQHIVMARNTAPYQEAHTDVLNAEQHLFWEHFQTYMASEGGGRGDVPMQQRNMELQVQLHVAETEATTQRRQADHVKFPTSIAPGLSRATEWGSTETTISTGIPTSPEGAKVFPPINEQQLAPVLTAVKCERIATSIPSVILDWGSIAIRALRRGE
ncbi:hypothetical protein SCP_0109200 [Sparassis crispa]|uniref:Uncharacterized protein n=1 Tax=Sparassis crispa TaxID=139825 RepID=A0A401G7B3_9APHY|nr:hypothetical protein SCP_0109200 [Sparassis crispa]GBE78038.1 hypothetical protein SCP_0109200 [Sparassis crispa]